MRFSKIDSLRADQLDFVPRERRNQLTRLIFAFGFVIGAIFLSAYVPMFRAFAIYTPLIAILLVALLCLYVVYHKQLSLDLVMAAEFQNMIFTQALSVGSNFCMIVRRDGTIVHASDGLSAIFPRFDYAQSQALEGVFEQGTVRKADRERLMGAIYSGTTDRLIFPIINQYQDRKEYIITVEPMPRPAGFSLIRGREYLGQRAGLQMMPDALRATSIEKLDHLLSTTPISHYTADNFGRFEYVNPAFEYLLGYGLGEVVESKLSLHHLFISFGAQTLTEEYSLGDYAGPATMLHKMNGHAPVDVRQIVIRDGQGKAVGVTGTVISTAAH
jgi:PAS domain-containing protein